MALAEIGIEELEICCVIGNRPEERIKEQTLFFTVRWLKDCTQVAQSDALEDTTDYTAVAELCRKIAVEGRFQMIEALGCTVVTQLLQHFSFEEVSLFLRKPAALSNSRGSTFFLKQKIGQPCRLHS